jgi:hypothetical protein
MTGRARRFLCRHQVEGGGTLPEGRARDYLSAEKENGSSVDLEPFLRSRKLSAAAI